MSAQTELDQQITEEQFAEASEAQQQQFLDEIAAKAAAHRAEQGDLGKADFSPDAQANVGEQAEDVDISTEEFQRLQAEYTARLAEEVRAAEEAEQNGSNLLGDKAAADGIQVTEYDALTEQDLNRLINDFEGKGIDEDHIREYEPESITTPEEIITETTEQLLLDDVSPEEFAQRLEEALQSNGLNEQDNPLHQDLQTQEAVKSGEAIPAPENLSADFGVEFTEKDQLTYEVVNPLSVGDAAALVDDAIERGEISPENRGQAIIDTADASRPQVTEQDTPQHSTLSEDIFNIDLPDGQSLDVDADISDKIVNNETTGDHPLTEEQINAQNKQTQDLLDEQEKLSADAQPLVYEATPELEQTLTEENPDILQTRERAALVEELQQAIDAEERQIERTEQDHYSEEFKDGEKYAKKYAAELAEKAAKESKGFDDEAVRDAGNSIDFQSDFKEGVESAPYGDLDELANTLKESGVKEGAELSGSSVQADDHDRSGDELSR